MTITSEKYIGIGVSKDKLDVASWGERRCLEIANGKRWITRLVKQMLTLAPPFIVVDAIGGHGEAVMLALFEAGLPVAERIVGHRLCF